MNITLPITQNNYFFLMYLSIYFFTLLFYILNFKKICLVCTIHFVLCFYLVLPCLIVVCEKINFLRKEKALKSVI